MQLQWLDTSSVSEWIDINHLNMIVGSRDDLLPEMTMGERVKETRAGIRNDKLFISK